jgi:hypothetical protein
MKSAPLLAVTGISTMLDLADYYGSDVTLMPDAGFQNEKTTQAALFAAVAIICYEL